MGFVKNIKILFVIRSFVRREIGIYVDQTKSRTYLKLKKWIR